MLKLIYDMFKQRPKSSAPPMDDDLKVFNEKIAGIRIQETEPNENGRVYNWVSEVHKAEGFKCETGIKVEITHTRKSPESAFQTYQQNKQPDNLLDDVPF
jgi:maltose-binding protein MalE